MYKVNPGKHNFAGRNVQLLICELNKSAFKAVAHMGIPPLVVVMNQGNEESSNKRQRHYCSSGARTFY